MASKGSRTLNQIKTDHDRRSKEVYITPCQYFLYHIPKGVFVVLPADTIHARGFCFGSKMKCPTKTKKMNVKDIFPESASLFYFLLLWNGREVVPM